MLKHDVTIALVGNPNCGKTTLFNALTGARQQVGNWAGVTIEAVVGSFHVQEQPCKIIDLPGIYTLTPAVGEGPSDEQFTLHYLRTEHFSYVLNVVDGAHLERHLYLTVQCLEQGLPTIVAVNKQEKSIDWSGLAEGLGCSVIGIAAKERKGLDPLKQALCESFQKKAFVVEYHPAIEGALLTVKKAYHEATGNTLTRQQQLAYLESQEEPVHFLDLNSIKNAIEQETGTAVDILIAMGRYRLIENLLATVKKNIPQECEDNQKTLWVDKVVCHRYLGIPIFLLVMYSLFFFAIHVGGFFQDYFEDIAHFIFVEKMMQWLQWVAMPKAVVVVIGAGIGEGITTVLSFIPVMGAMFFALAFLEECGYMARAAFVIDRLMRLIGLPGKSFVPMIVGFGCNVPAIMGMRTLENKRDRILAVMMSPFMSCGARLAIFTVFVSTFFAEGGQNIVFFLYATGIVMAIVTGLFLKKTLLKGEHMSLFLEMPLYQYPDIKALGLQAWHRLKRFIGNAAKLIIPVCLVMGLLNNISVKGDSSVLAEAGKMVTPLFSPMGIEQDNWPATVGLLTGILAKEVVIGTLKTLYFEEQGSSELRFSGQTSAFAYLLFVLLYVPCVSAMAAMLREVQRGWTLFAMCWTTSVAYVVAVGYYQLATFAEHPLQTVGWLIGLIALMISAFWGARYYSKVLLKGFPTPVIVR